MRAGVSDLFGQVYGGEEEATLAADMCAERAASVMAALVLRDVAPHRMSDHLPMWVELETDFAAEALRGMLKSPTV
ncbi:MAG: hypothetical protein RLO52_14580 [Sandaracinaceae bacterium]